MTLALLDMIRAEVVAGNVNEQTHPVYPHLSIFKYSEKCSFEKAWNPINRICRGLIINTQTGEIVARSFPKFYNVGEMPESCLENLPLDELFDAYDKMDGSMGSAYRLPNGEWAIATPGSMDSPQAREATKMLAQYNLNFIPENVTVVVEIIYPENRVVVDYGDKRELVILAAFYHDGHEVDRHQVFMWSLESGMPIVHRYNEFDIKNPSFKENQEGYVIRFKSGLRVKIKSPVYVMAHRFLTNISIPRVIEAFRDGSLASVAAQCPETWRSKLDDLTGLVNTRFAKINAEIMAYWQRVSAIPSVSKTDIKTWRKEMALWIQANVPREYQGGVFLKISNKDTTEFVWKIVEEQLKYEQEQINPPR